MTVSSSAAAFLATSWPIAPSPRMPSVLPASGSETRRVHRRASWSRSAAANGFVRWKSAAEDVLRHLDAVGAARARQREPGREAAVEPALDAGRERLDPAEARRGAKRIARDAPRERALRKRPRGPDRRVSPVLRVWSSTRLAEPRALDGPHVDLGVVEPEEDERSRHGRYDTLTPARPPGRRRHIFVEEALMPASHRLDATVVHYEWNNAIPPRLVVGAWRHPRRWTRATRRTGTTRRRPRAGTRRRAALQGPPADGSRRDAGAPGRVTCSSSTSWRCGRRRRSAGPTSGRAAGSCRRRTSRSRSSRSGTCQTAPSRGCGPARGRA